MQLYLCSALAITTGALLACAYYRTTTTTLETDRRNTQAMAYASAWPGPEWFCYGERSSTVSDAWAALILLSGGRRSALRPCLRRACADVGRRPGVCSIASESRRRRTAAPSVDTRSSDDSDPYGRGRPTGMGGTGESLIASARTSARCTSDRLFRGRLIPSRLCSA
jgi:hypothetical protein